MSPKTQPISERLPERVFREIHRAIGQAGLCTSGDGKYVFNAQKAADIALDLCNFIADEYSDAPFPAPRG